MARGSQSPRALFSNGATVFSIDSIELDTSIQCRASIDVATVNEYADAMADGVEFPPVVLFGNQTRAWIGDGWHRVMAAQQIGAPTIDADIRPGDRREALKYALNANAAHGQRRTNADKRRCVEIALREFGKLSSRAIAEMCGVSDRFVDGLRPQSGANDSHVTRTGTDGKQYPATRTTTTQTKKVEEINQEEAPTNETEIDLEQYETERPHTTRPRGSYDDWTKLRDLADSIKSMAQEMSALRVDAQHKIPARTLCESLAGQFSKLSQRV